MGHASATGGSLCFDVTCGAREDVPNCCRSGKAGDRADRGSCGIPPKSRFEPGIEFWYKRCRGPGPTPVPGPRSSRPPERQGGRHGPVAHPRQADRRPEPGRRDDAHPDGRLDLRPALVPHQQPDAQPTSSASWGRRTTCSSSSSGSHAAPRRDARGDGGAEPTGASRPARRSWPTTSS